MAREQTKIPNHRIPELARRKIFSYTLIYTLAALLLVAFISIFPLYNQLKEAEENSLAATARTRAVAIGEYIGRIKDIALQITSRSAIRERLAAFSRGRVSLAELKEFTRPRLEDALRGSKEILGITRLSADGRTVTSVGVSIPLNGPHLPPPKARRYCSTGRPFSVGPWCRWSGSDSRQQRHQPGYGPGRLFHRRLQKIVQAPDGLGKTGVCLLGKASEGGKSTIFFQGGTGQQARLQPAAGVPRAEQALKQAARGKSGRIQCRGE